MGRVIAGTDEHMREVELTIERVVAGPITAPAEVVLEEFGYDGDDTPFAMEDMTWSQAGDHGLFFLYQSARAPEGHYRLLSPDGRLLFDRNEVVSFADIKLGEALDALTPTEVLDQSRRAIAAAASRRVQPREEMLVPDCGVEREPYPRESILQDDSASDRSTPSSPVSVDG